MLESITGRKRIAALTMLRDDDGFLRKWVEYYSSCLGAENLYVFFDGTDQKVPEFCDGIHCRVVEHVDVSSPREGDRIRINFLSKRAAELFAAGYDMVIGTDVDEFLVADPALGLSLVDFLSGMETSLPSISGLGIDVGHKLGEEGDLDWSALLLSQRSYAKLSTRYSKATVLCRPVEWGSGFHRTRHGNFHIHKGLYLFHFGCADMRRIKSRMALSTLKTEGWERHLKKRASTIDLVTRKEARDWDRTVGTARIIQNVFRPPYAWNKPSMFEAALVVRIPERFKHLV